MSRFEEERIGDFKDSLEAFLEGMIGRQKQVGLALIIAFVHCVDMFREAYRRLGELPKCSTEKSEYDAKAGAIELRIRGRSVVYGGQFASLQFVSRL